MNIAVVGNFGKPVTAFSQGGTEVWTANFINEFSKKGTCNLYAVKGSLHMPPQVNLTDVLSEDLDHIKKNPFFSQATSPDKELAYFSASLLTKISVILQEHISEYDIVVDSCSDMILPFTWDTITQDKPLIIIGHMPVYHRYAKFFQFQQVPKNVFFVFPSQYQFEEAKWIDNTQKKVIQHGIPLEKIYPDIDPVNKSDLVWVGRIDPLTPKGLNTAVDTAFQLKKVLRIYGPIEDTTYYKNKIEPKISNSILLQTNVHDKNELFKNSRAFLFPIEWEEPFGLVMVESMATGTPVIAYARGATKEIIKDGETGFLVNPSDIDIRGNFIIKKTGQAGIQEAVERIYSMPDNEYARIRQNCRRHVENLFTIEKMVNQYIDFFKTL
jgi:glycosyltransferase involved in cell wall biosynthesis